MVVTEDAICTILRLLRSCNRSTPHMELLKHALNVLYNLSVCRWATSLQQPRQFLSQSSRK